MRFLGIGRKNKATEAKEPPNERLILVVEDDDRLRQAVVRQLNGLGYKTLEGSRPEEAIEILNAGHKIDLLFTDILMPGEMDGFSVAQHALKISPGIRVLLTSGLDDSINIGDKLGADHNISLLTKPYVLDELATAVKSALE